jgi:DNA-binding XRE family transcriptional regulator
VRRASEPLRTDRGRVLLRDEVILMNAFPSTVRLSLLRHRLQIPARTLARRAGVDIKTLANVEKQRHKPHPSTMELLWEGLRREAHKREQAGTDTTNWPRCTGCHELLFADSDDDLVCADCRFGGGVPAEIKRAVIEGEKQAEGGAP